jgi:hypothetical protein
MTFASRSLSPILPAAPGRASPFQSLCVGLCRRAANCPTHRRRCGRRRGVPGRRLPVVRGGVCDRCPAADEHAQRRAALRARGGRARLCRKLIPRRAGAKTRHRRGIGQHPFPALSFRVQLLIQVSIKVSAHVMPEVRQGVRKPTHDLAPSGMRAALPPRAPAGLPRARTQGAGKPCARPAERKFRAAASGARVLQNSQFTTRANRSLQRTSVQTKHRISALFTRTCGQLGDTPQGAQGSQISTQALPFGNKLA